MNGVLGKVQLFSLSSPANVWCEGDINHDRTFSFVSEAS